MASSCLIWFQIQLHDLIQNTKFVEMLRRCPFVCIRTRYFWGRAFHFCNHLGHIKVKNMFNLNWQNYFVSRTGHVSVSSCQSLYLCERILDLILFIQTWPILYMIFFRMFPFHMTGNSEAEYTTICLQDFSKRATSAINSGLKWELLVNHETKNLFVEIAKHCNTYPKSRSKAKLAISSLTGK